MNTLIGTKKATRLSQIENRKELVLKAQQKVPGAFEALIKDIQPMIRAYVANRIKDTYHQENIAQDAIIKIYRMLDKYDGQRSFNPWLYTVLRNVLIDYIRKEKRRTSHECGVEDLAEKSPSPQPLANNLLHVQDLNRIWGLMSASEKEIIWLAKVEGRSLAEVAKMLNISLAAAKTRVSRALKELRVHLEQEAV